MNWQSVWNPSFGSMDKLETLITNKSPEFFSASLPERYQLGEVLGQGGMGVVYRALDTQLQRDVAIKFLLFEGSHDQSLQERFLKEAQTLALLNHTNIVKLYSSGLNANGDPYHVMEFLHGISLAQEMKKNPENLRMQFRQIISQILDGLEHAHEQQIVHRDLKPSNILLCRNDQNEVVVKVIDFGIARQLDEEGGGKTLTKTNAMLGSPGYMSPEQCIGERGTKVSDIYSLACIMYEICNGKPPFDGDTAIEIMYKQINEMPARLEQPTKTLKGNRFWSLIQACLQKDPALRPQTIQALRKSFEEIADKDWHQTSESLQKVRIGRKKQIVLVGLALLSILAVAGFFTIKNFYHPKKTKQAIELSPQKSSNDEKIQKALKIARNHVQLARTDLNATSNEDEHYEKAKQLAGFYLELARQQMNSDLPEEIRLADQTCRSGISLCQKEHLMHDRASILLLQGNLALKTGNLNECEKHFNECYEIVLKMDDPRKLDWQDIAMHRSVLQIKQEKFDEALKSLSGVHQIWKDHPNSPNIAVCHNQSLDPNGPSRISLLARTEKVFSELPFDKYDKVTKGKLLALSNMIIKLCRDTTQHQEAIEAIGISQKLKLAVSPDYPILRAETEMLYHKVSEDKPKGSI